MDKLQFLNDHQLPFAKVLGLKFVAASETGVKAEMVVTPELCTRPDILHGGAMMAFADTLGAAATVLNLPEGKGTTTIESKTNFVGPAPVGTTVIGETTADPSRPTHPGLDDAHHDRRGQARGRRHADTDGPVEASASNSTLLSVQHQHRPRRRAPCRPQRGSGCPFAAS